MQNSIDILEKPQPVSGKSLTGFFLHPSFFSNPDILLRARILIATLYAFISIVITVILLLLVTPVAPISRLVGIPANIAIVTTIFYLLFSLKRHGNYALCAGTTVAIPLTTITLSICITGGIIHSPLAQLMVLSPLMAYFYGSIRSGNITVVTAGAMIFLLIVLQQSGMEFPQTILPQHRGVAQALVLFVDFAVLAALAVIYEITSASLRRARDEEHAKVVKLAHTDALTGLANRRIFDATLTERITAYAGTIPQRQFALCYLDLDGFKPINDRHGHDVGDQVLRTISIRLRSALRGADLIGRHGGDEFMLILDALGAGRALEVMAKRFLTLINEPIETSAGLLSVGASLGFAVYPDQAISTEALKKAADSAMYVAKRQRLGWQLSNAALDNATNSATGKGDSEQ